MSTAPNLSELESTLQALYTVSQEFLQTKSTEPEVLEAFMVQREQLIGALQGMDLTGLSRDREETTRTLIQQIQALDGEINTHFEEVFDKTKVALKQIAMSRTATTGYTFPTIDTSGGWESQG